MNVVRLPFRSRRQSQPSLKPLPDWARDAFAEKATKIFGDLQRRRVDNTMSEAEIVLIFVHYLYGLVATALPDAEPSVTLGFLLELADSSLNADDVTRALQASPPPVSTPIGRVIRGAEMLGRRDAEAILASFNGTAGDPASEPTTTVASAELNKTIQPDSKGRTP